jgi:hypothetical protein
MMVLCLLLKITMDKGVRSFIGIWGLLLGYSMDEMGD